MQTPTQKIALTIPEALHASSLGRTKLYELFRDGVIRPRKVGRRTLVLRDELEAFLSSLPPSA